MAECFKKKIVLGNAKYLVVDLTEPLSDNTQVYPGDPKLTKKVFSDIHTSGWQYHVYRLGDHIFHPHGDAPNHQNVKLKDKGFETFDISYCFNRACLIDLSKCKNAEKFEGINYLVRVEEKHLNPYSNIIRGKNAVLIRTGYDKWLEANNTHTLKGIPYFSEGAVDFISKFKSLKVIGTDSLTIDPAGCHYAHKKFKNLLIVESMVHLHLIPESGWKNFFLQTSPVRIVGATGGPVVAYAFIKKT